MRQSRATLLTTIGGIIAVAFMATTGNVINLTLMLGACILLVGFVYYFTEDRFIIRTVTTHGMKRGDTIWLEYPDAHRERVWVVRVIDEQRIEVER